MTDSAIERLKNRQRKKVPTRNASLNQGNNKDTTASNDSISQTSQSINELNSNDSISQTSQSINELNSNDSISQTSQSINELNSNGSIPQTSQSINELNSNDSIPKTSQSVISTDNEPVRRTIRLDPEVDEYMDTLCKANKVTKETLFEAAILVCSNNQKTLKKVIANAQERYGNRKRIGEMKKLQTMNRKFQSHF